MADVNNNGIPDDQEIGNIGADDQSVDAALAAKRAAEAKSAQDIANAAEQASQAQVSDEPWVFRTLPKTERRKFYGITPWTSGYVPKQQPTYEATISPGVKASMSKYSGEYGLRLRDDPGFEDWLIRRGAALGFTNLTNADGSFDSNAGWSFWNWLGNVVVGNPELQGSITPEMWADQMYAGAGGDQAYDAMIEAKARAAAGEAANPITTMTSTSYRTMNPQAAEAAVDQLARALLGRMASEKELVRYRKQINSFLKANPTISTTTTNATDPANVKSSTATKGGASEADAMNVLEMRLRRGSEGMAFNAGKMIEEALMGGGNL